MIKNKIILMLSNVLLYFTALGQSDNYCHKNYLNDRIGERIKIYSSNEIYATLNTGSHIKWPSQEIKLLSGENSWGDFYPKSGDTGIIAHLLGRMNNVDLYIIKVKQYYIPIACDGITFIDSLDEDKEAEDRIKHDSLLQAAYEGHCFFKKHSRRFNIDILSEVFSCNLKESGVDTIILIKSSPTFGSVTHGSASILWIKDKVGLIKEYYFDDKMNIIERDNRRFDVISIIDDFFTNKIDLVSTNPESNIRMSHSWYYTIHLNVNSLQYINSIPVYLVGEKIDHPNALWWYRTMNKIKQ